MRASTVAVAGVTLALSATVLSAQKTDWKKGLRQQLEEAYPLTKFALFDPNAVAKAGPVFVIQRDGVMAERVTETNRVRATYIRDGQLRQDSGTGRLLGAVLNGEVREDARAFKKGERVYIADIRFAGDHAFQLGLASSDVADVSVHGNTKQTRFKGALVFEFAKGALATMDMTALKAAVAPFLLSETEASVPKSIELGQGIADVERTLGKPTAIAKLGAKTIYTYPSIKVVFTNGKVSDVQ
jgi:hypothetical protein